MQSCDRRIGQGPSRPRDRCAGRDHGARDRPRRDPVSHTEPFQGAGGARAPCAGRSQTLPAGRAGAAGGPGQPGNPGGRGCRYYSGYTRRVCRRRHRVGCRDRRRSGDPDDGHLSARAHPHGRDQDPGRPRAGRWGRGTVNGARGDFASPGFQAGAPQDGHAGPARRPHDRLCLARTAERRRPAATLFLPDGPDYHAAGALPYHDDHARDPRDHPRQSASGPHVFGADRECRPALLSLDRGQGRPVRPA